MLNLEKLRPYLQELKHGRISLEDLIYGGLSKNEYDWILSEFIEWNAKQKDEFDESDMPLSDPIFKTVSPFTWGSSHMDEVFSPIEPWSYIVFAGTRGSGKTAFTVDFAIKNAKIGKIVLYISLEMSTPNIKTRIARSAAMITKAQWRVRDIPDYKKREYLDRKKELKALEGLLFYGFGTGMYPTCEAIAEVIDRKSPDITVVDNFDLIAKEHPNQTEHEKLASDFFMNLAKDTSRPLIMVHHLRKTKDTSAIDSIRGNGKITDNATGTYICSRRTGEELSQRERAEFLIYEKKDREFGEEGFARLYFHKGSFGDCYIQPVAKGSQTMIK